MKRTIRLINRYATRELAEAVIAFLPACGWRVAQDSRGWFWAECRIDVHRSLRILELIRKTHPDKRFEAVGPDEDAQ